MKGGPTLSHTYTYSLSLTHFRPNVLWYEGSISLSLSHTYTYTYTTHTLSLLRYILYLMKGPSLSYSLFSLQRKHASPTYIAWFLTHKLPKWASGLFSLSLSLSLTTDLSFQLYSLFLSHTHFPSHLSFRTHGSCQISQIKDKSQILLKTKFWILKLAPQYVRGGTRTWRRPEWPD